MKKHIARLLRRTAQRIDPQPLVYMRPGIYTSCTTSSNGPATTVTWR